MLSSHRFRLNRHVLQQPLPPPASRICRSGVLLPVLFALGACGDGPGIAEAGGTTGEDASSTVTGSAGGVTGEPESTGPAESTGGATTTGDVETSGSTGEADEPLNAELVGTWVVDDTTYLPGYYRVQDGVVQASTPLLEDDFGRSWARPTLLSGRRMLFFMYGANTGQLRLVDLNGDIPASSLRLDGDDVDSRFFVVEADESVLYERNGAIYRVETDLDREPSPQFLATIPTVFETPFGPFEYSFDPTIDPLGGYAITDIMQDGESRLARVALDGSSVDLLPSSWTSAAALTQDGDAGYFLEYGSDGGPMRIHHAGLEGSTPVVGTELLTAEPTPSHAFALEPRPGAVTGGAMTRVGEGDTRRLLYVALHDGVGLDPIELAVGDEVGWLNASHWSHNGRYFLLSNTGGGVSTVRVADFGNGHSPEIITMQVGDSDVERVSWGPEFEALYVTHRSNEDSLARVDRSLREDGFAETLQPVFPSFFLGQTRGFSSDHDTMFMAAQVRSGEGAALHAVDLSQPQPAEPVRLSRFPTAYEDIRNVTPSPTGNAVAYSVSRSSADPDQETSSAQLFIVDLDDSETWIELGGEMALLTDLMFLPPAE